MGRNRSVKQVKIASKPMKDSIDKSKVLSDEEVVINYQSPKRVVRTRSGKRSLQSSQTEADEHESNPKVRKTKKKEKSKVNAPKKNSIQEKKQTAVDEKFVNSPVQQGQEVDLKSADEVFEPNDNEVIVASSGSLIKSIKKRKGINLNNKSPAKSPKTRQLVAPQRGVDNRQEINDGIEIDVSASDDDISGGNTSHVETETDHSVGQSFSGSQRSSDVSESNFESENEDTVSPNARGRSRSRPRQNDSKERSYSRGWRRSYTPNRIRGRRGQSSSTSTSDGYSDDDYAELKKNPKFRRYMRKLKRKEDSKVRRCRRRSESRSRSRHSKKRSRSRSKVKRRGRTTHKSPTEVVKDQNVVIKRTTPIVKSLSDTTIYRPALRKEKFQSQFQGTPVPQVSMSPLQNNLTSVDHLSNVVGQISVSDHRDSTSCTPDRNLHEHRSSSHRDRSPSPDDVAEQHAEKHIIDAEKFKASIAVPTTGNGELLSSEQIKKLLELANNTEDDEFYHITCHVESKLKQKIAKGEHVELEVLIPKSRSQIIKEDDRLQQFVMKNGSTYWAPPEKEVKINNIRKWEQAFRIYAVIYCQANPNRSVEIWQYVHTINNATVSFAWENVAYYDSTFRQLMGENPSHSWAKIYLQLWHTAMCDPLPKVNQQLGGASNSNTKYTDWRDCCCWRFNRGKCRKWNCPYDHRCTVCGGYNHNAKNCNNKKKSGNTQNYQPKERECERSRTRSRSPYGKKGGKKK